jgi:Rad3-related DNA helicase
LEDQLISHFTCEVDFAFLQKIGASVPPFPSEEKAANVLKWLTQMIGNMNIKLEEYTQYFKDAKGKDSTFMKKKGEYTKLQNLINKVALLIQTYYESQYIIEHSDTGVKFTPLKIDKLSNYLFRNADTVIFLSATIIDHANFCKHLGVTDYKYIEVGSLFDPKKSPIYILAKQKLNFKNLKEMLTTLCDQVAGILSAHPNSKGIIHTHTQYIADYIRDRVKSDRLLCRMDGVKNEDILQQHFESTEPTVLVSPSMSYGVDLKGDLAEFQILLKAPWMPTKDPRVEKMMRMDSTWYSNKMLCTLVQACGRGVRAASDECETYILDGSIYDAIARNKSRLPKYFLDRIV